jgi:serine/threonine protein kinase
MIRIDINGYVVTGVCSESLARELLTRVDQQDLPQYLAHLDNHRMLSAQFELHGKKLVLKIPRARNARRWERVLTLFRGSDVARIYQGMQTLAKHSVLGIRPVFIAEKNVAGMTVDSFLIYEYLEGRPCTDDDAELIAKSVLKLHDLGLVRDDIHLGNFLITPDGQLGMIDFRISQPKTLRQLRLDFELVQMLNSIPSTRKHISNERLSSTIFRVATAWHFVQTRARKIRKKIKGLVPHKNPCAEPK